VPLKGLRERLLLLVYSSRFIVNLKVYSNHRQLSLSAHSTVESQCVYFWREISFNDDVPTERIAIAKRLNTTYLKILLVIELYIDHYNNIVVIIFCLLGCMKLVAFLPSKIDMFSLKSVFLVL